MTAHSVKFWPCSCGIFRAFVFLRHLGKSSKLSEDVSFVPEILYEIIWYNTDIYLKLLHINPVIDRLICVLVFTVMTPGIEDLMMAGGV